MTDKTKSNKNSASEDMLGEAHYLVSWLHLERLKKMRELINLGADIGEIIGDGKVLDSAAKWVADRNGITCAMPEATEDNELKRELDSIKARARKQMGGNVISFYDEEDEA